MSVDHRGMRKGGFPALSLFLGICCACAFSSLVSCSSNFSRQESLVRDLLEAARNQDLSKATTLMPRMSLLTAEQQKRALDSLSRIGAYRITGSSKEGDAVLVTIEYFQGSNAMSLIIPVRKEGESWIIGDDFRIRRSLQGETIERSAPPGGLVRRLSRPRGRRGSHGPSRLGRGETHRDLGKIFPQRGIRRAIASGSLRLTCTGKRP
jgi:hypothetical protein